MHFLFHHFFFFFQKRPTVIVSTHTHVCTHIHKNAPAHTHTHMEGIGLGGGGGGGGDTQSNKINLLGKGTPLSLIKVHHSPYVVWRKRCLLPRRKAWSPIFPTKCGWYAVDTAFLDCEKPARKKKQITNMQSAIEESNFLSFGFAAAGSNDLVHLHESRRQKSFTQKKKNPHEYTVEWELLSIGVLVSKKKKKTQTNCPSVMMTVPALCFAFDHRI